MNIFDRYTPIELIGSARQGPTPTSVCLLSPFPTPHTYTHTTPHPQLPRPRRRFHSCPLLCRGTFDSRYVPTPRGETPTSGCVSRKIQGYFIRTFPRRTETSYSRLPEKRVTPNICKCDKTEGNGLSRSTQLKTTGPTRGTENIHPTLETVNCWFEKHRVLPHLLIFCLFVQNGTHKNTGPLSVVKPFSGSRGCPQVTSRTGETSHKHSQLKGSRPVTSTNTSWSTDE